MRMILIHGINQQGKNADKIRDMWVASLSETLGRMGDESLGRLSNIKAAFYGDELERLSSAKFKSEAISLGIEETSDDFDEFAVDAFKEMALRIGATEEQIMEQMGQVAVAQAAGINKRWLKATARVIEKISPARGTLALRFLKQAHAYIRNQHVHDEVNALVRPLFEDDEPAIIISHSLGTIVSYSILREFEKNGRPRHSPLFITLGSPLGIDCIRKGFSKPRTKPDNVVRWVNGADPEDFVALRPELTSDNFGIGIENYPDIDNGNKDPHSIIQYLKDVRIAKAIAQTIP